MIAHEVSHLYGTEDKDDTYMKNRVHIDIYGICNCKKYTALQDNPIRLKVNRNEPILESDVIADCLAFIVQMEEMGERNDINSGQISVGMIDCP